MNSISPAQVILRYVEYLSYFLIYGALGFRWLLLRTQKSLSSSVSENRFYENARRGAARMGIAGALLLAVELIVTALSKMTPAHGFSAAAGPKGLIQLTFALLAFLAFIGAVARIPGAWIAASVTAVGFVFRNAMSRNKWTAPVNPLHEAAGAIWLGTLLLIVVVGLPAIRRAQLDSGEQRSLLALLIKKFSFIALFGASFLAATGVITSWTHLKFVAALWTTSYGITLCLKLLVVLAVTALGAWNWRRIGPALHLTADSDTLRRLSTAELALGALVLLITAVLVLLPSPKPVF